MVGRLRKAEQFLRAASVVRESTGDEGDVGDAYVTLCVHAGIAAADAICCAALKEHAQGESHAEAVQLVKRVRPDGAALARALETLLGMKTRAGYGAQAATAAERRRAQRSAEKLLRAARDRATT
jgi:hypothetical protein